MGNTVGDDLWNCNDKIFIIGIETQCIASLHWVKLVHIMERFRNLYKIDSTRHPSWDYSWQGIYYVTICTLDKENYFGEIVDKHVVLNKLGKFANKQWLLTPNIRPDMNIKLGAHIIMPNHVHGIIKIGDNIFNRIRNNEMRGRDAMHCVSTLGKFGPQRKNLSSIIRGYKSCVTTFARKNDLIFDWQSRFDDRIIDDINGLMFCEQYIRNNPIHYKK